MLISQLANKHIRIIFYFFSLMQISQPETQIVSFLVLYSGV